MFLREIYCITTFLSEGLRMHYRVTGAQDVLSSLTGIQGGLDMVLSLKG